MQVFDFKGKYKQYWYKATDYKLDAGMLISPIDETKIDFYNPFNYYQNSIPEDTVSSIFPDKKSSKLNLHTAFASLNYHDNEMLLRWVCAFGVPFTMYVKTVNKMPRHSNFPISLPISVMEKEKLELREHWIFTDHFAREVERFQLMMQLKSALEANDIKALEENYNLNMSGESKLMDHNTHMIDEYSKILSDYINTTEINQGYRKVHKVKDDYTNKLIGQALYNLEIIMNPALIGVKPALSFYKEQSNKSFYMQQPTWQWEFNSLLSAIYLMVFLDWVQGRSMLCCENPKCTTYFIPSKISSKYCSPSCQSSAKQKRYRDEQKKFKQQ